jgi:hypothetical protein
MGIWRQDTHRKHEADAERERRYAGDKLIELEKANAQVELTKEGENGEDDEDDEIDEEEGMDRSESEEQRAMSQEEHRREQGHQRNENYRDGRWIGEEGEQEGGAKHRENIDMDQDGREPGRTEDSGRIADDELQRSTA